ncbi:hypothetical protein [Altererythrobacter sp. Root672]|nr:hypothetical protein [Altererythrobacter sp. Root672]
MSKEEQRRRQVVREQKKVITAKVGIVLVAAGSLAAWAVMLFD